MITIAINLTLVEIVVLPLVAIILGVTIYFFLKSRKDLEEAIQPKKKNILTDPKHASYQRSSLVELEEQFAKKRFETSAKKEEPVAYIPKPVHVEANPSQELKSTIAQQQKLLNSYLDKIEELENEGRQELNDEIQNLEIKIDKLNAALEEKDEEIKDLRQQASAAQRMASKIEEVYKEFDQLQEKMQILERQANRANNLAIELEDAKYSYEQVHKELLRKQEKLEEVMNENQHLRLQLNDVEDKLSDSNLQRQQLQKKVLFLTDLNNDMQSVSDTNKKLQTELRRIGELESMLNMMAEERDFLLRKKTDK